MRGSATSTAGPQPDDVDPTVAGDAPRGQVLVAATSMLIARRLEVPLDEPLWAGDRSSAWTCPEWGSSLRLG